MTEIRSKAVRRDVFLPATREEAWGALTESERLSAWFEADVQIEPHPRGVVVARSADGTSRKGTVISANPPYRLVLVWDDTWDGDGNEVPASRVEFTFEAVEEGTVLTVVETPATGAESLLLRAAR